MDQIELKPCPFCGENNIKHYTREGRGNGLIDGEIYCCSCGIVMGAPRFKGEFDDEAALKKVAKTWNTRTSSWISVDELPENDTQCIAWVGERALVLFYCDDGYWCEHYGSHDYSSNVTHWMPLPQMPEVKHG